jgi:hypothetical protein
MAASSVRCVHVFLDGSVWEMTPRGALKRVADSVASYSANRAAEYRVIGCPVNYSLLAGPLLSPCRGVDVYVRRPQGLPPNASPAFLLSYLATSSISDAVLPFWSKLTGVDVAVYQMLQLQLSGVSGLLWWKYFTEQPLFPCFLFLDDYPGREWACLLEAIVDPRWYVAWSRPGKVTRLQRHFGLQSATGSAIKRSRYEALAACAKQARQGENRGRIAEGERGMAQVLQFVALYWLGLLRLDSPAGVVLDSSFLPAALSNKLKETFHD